MMFCIHLILSITSIFCKICSSIFLIKCNLNMQRSYLQKRLIKKLCINKRYFLNFIYLLFSLVLSSCVNKNKNIQIYEGEQIIKFDTREGMNYNSPVIVDIIQVYDEKTWENIKKITSHKYFEYKSEIINKPSKLLSWSFEPVPILQTKRTAYKLQGWQPEAFGTIIFSGYKTKGPHRVILSAKLSSALITLGKYKIESIKSTPAPTVTLPRSPSSAKEEHNEVLLTVDNTTDHKQITEVPSINSDTKNDKDENKGDNSEDTMNKLGALLG